MIFKQRKELKSTKIRENMNEYDSLRSEIISTQEIQRNVWIRKPAANFAAGFQFILFLQKRKAIRHTGTAAATSRMECCFKNTVEKQMSSISIVIKTVFPGESSPFVRNAENHTATEPIACSEGKMFVFVSTEYNRATQSVKKLSRGNSTGRKFWQLG